MQKLRSSFGLAVIAFVSGCSGGSGTSPVTPKPVSVSGDFLPQTAYRGANYQGTSNSQPITLTMYNNPPSNGTNSSVLLAKFGTFSDATSGTSKSALVSFSGNATAGYGPQNYTLYDTVGNVAASGMLPGGTLLVPGTLTVGQTYTPYMGVTALVKTVGTVPGSTACPTPSAGAQVQFTFQGGTYLLSFVPGCGLTQYVGNNGETFTLTSIGSYPTLGTLGDVKTLSQSSVLDTIKSVVHIVIQGQGFSFWHLAK